MSHRSLAGVLRNAGLILTALAAIAVLAPPPVALAYQAPAAAGTADGSIAVSHADPATWGISDVIRQSDGGTVVSERPAGPALIHLGAGYTFDPAGGEPERLLPADLVSAPPRAGERGYLLVQFSGPITGADHQLLEAAGATIVQYVPDYAFLVSLTGAARERLSAAPRVRWTGLYQPAYKISTLPRTREPGTRDYVVLLFPGESIEAARTALTAAGGDVVETSDNGINQMLKVSLAAENVGAVARLSAVAWIEPHQVPQWHNNQAQWVVQTWTNNNRRLWDLGIRGQNQVINVVDTGIRVTHRMFHDAAVPIPYFGDYPTHRKIIAYQRTVATVSITFGDEGINGYHGTHTSGTTSGDDSPHTSDNRDGMAIESKLYFNDGGGLPDPGVFIPLDLNDLYIMPYNGNAAGAARISSNSWGNDTGGAYDTQCMAADQFMWNHPDFLIFFSNGNAGGPNTVGSPATSKNCVGAGGTGNGTSANVIYGSTSRGPTDDNRIKPTICSPARLSSAYGAGDTNYVQYEGTSMACPSMAGATLLLRQYLTDGWYPTGAPVPGNSLASPSAALLKAMAINSADPDVTGFTVPDNNIGWGRIDDDQVAYFTGDARRLALIENTAGLLTGEYVEYQVYVASNSLPLKAALVWTDYPGNPANAVQLVNDLNLVASDGVNVYKGNVYSGGQSITGGSADNRNVEECVRRNSPAPGIWTFRIEGFNVPIGPQRFALVVTGDLGSDAGVVSLDQPVYGGQETVGIRVTDTNAGGNISVTLTSDTEPSGETLVLNGASGVYQGAYPLSIATPASGDGRLSVSDGDIVTVSYDDINPPNTLEATATVNISGPAISDVHASLINEADVTLAWNTTAAATSKVYYGTSPALGSETTVTPTLTQSHAVRLDGLMPSTLYYYDVESVDNQGNAVRDDNGGLHYTVSTDINRDILLVLGDATFDKKDYYTNAFARSGWTYTVWEGNQAATPHVGNLNTGMASYKAVVWQTGYEQYPMFTEAARDSMARLNDLGSRTAVWSHDVAWDFCDPASPDYSAATKLWFETQWKATYQTDPTTFSIVRGITNDPISGAYTGGISYTPIRDGGAGDQINGISTGGSFAYVWRNNSDDIAVRWTGDTPVGDPSLAVWGGTPRKVSSNFFEWSRLNAAAPDDAVRSDVLDKTLIWLIGHDHPSVAITAPNGGENFTGNSVSISWTESVDSGYTVASRKLYFSDNGGDRWTLITASAGPSPYNWDISGVPNGAQYKVRIVLSDNASPALSAADNSNANFTINRSGGDSRGPVVLAGSIATDPNPVLVPNPATLTATISDVYQGNTNIAGAEWSAGPDPAPAGSGTAMTGTFTSPLVAVSAILDSNTLSSGSETIWVRGRDNAGNWGNASSFVVVVNGGTSGLDLHVPLAFALHVNSPNPFEGRTDIRFDLPASQQVHLYVFDVGGRRVRTLWSGRAAAGASFVRWDGRDADGREVNSGVYFYRLEAGEQTAVRKMTIVR